MGTLTETMRWVVTVDPSGGVAGLKSLSGEVSRTDKVVSSFGERMNTAANYGAAGLTALTAVVAKASATHLALGESIDGVTDVTNLSAESASRLVGQWESFGVSASAGANAVKLFEKNLDEARRGNEGLIESFGRAGVSVEELGTLSDEDIFAQLRDGLAGMADTGAQAAVALQLLGKSGTELSDWYAATPDDMARVNEQLERMGLVWGSDELQTWQDVIDKQRELRIASLGLQVTIAEEVMPHLPPLIEGFGRLLRVLSPLTPVIIPAAAALAAFVGVVKTVMIAQTAAGALKGLYAVIGGTQALTAASTGFRVLTANIGLMTATAGISIGMLGALALAVTASTAAVVGAVIAWQQWRDAVDQANKAHQEYLDNYDKARARMVEKYGEGSEQVNKWDSSLGPKKEAQYSEPWWNPFGWFANGGDFMTNGPVVFGAGEAGPERVTITPLGSSRRTAGAGAGLVLNFNFSGPVMGGRAGIREFMQIAGEEADLAMGGLV